MQPSNLQPPKSRKAPCNECRGETNHLQLHVIEVPFENEYVWGTTRYETLQCQGCDSIRLRLTSSSSEDFPGYDPDSDPVFYPPQSFRHLPPWLESLPIDGEEVLSIRGTFLEVYVALKNGLPRLAAMGIRSIIEQIAIQKVGDQGTFLGNLKALKDQELISAWQHGVLASVYDAGSAILHRGWKPEKHEVDLMIDVAESLVQAFYTIEKRVAQLDARVPPRKSQP